MDYELNQYGSKAPLLNKKGEEHQCCCSTEKRKNTDEDNDNVIKWSNKTYILVKNTHIYSLTVC